MLPSDWSMSTRCVRLKCGGNLMVKRPTISDVLPSTPDPGAGAGLDKVVSRHALEAEDVVVVELEVAGILVGNAVGIAAIRRGDELHDRLEQQRRDLFSAAGHEGPAPVERDIGKAAADVVGLDRNIGEIDEIIVGDATEVANNDLIDFPNIPVKAHY